MKTYIIDRFEGLYAICENEDKSFTPILRKKLPIEAKEGDVIYQRNGKYVVDAVKTKNKNQVIRNKMNDLFE